MAKVETVAKPKAEKVAVAQVGGMTAVGVGAETMTVAVAKAGGATVAGPEAGAAARAPPPL